MRKILFTILSALLLWGCSQQPQRPAACDNIVVAHRGGSKEAGLPDNSIAALRYAKSLGCYASECDIYWTKDDNVVVAHADKNCQISGLHPWEHTLEELRATGRLENGEPLPSLEEYIAECMREQDGKPSCTRLWLDIKRISYPEAHHYEAAQACRRACEIIKEMGAENFVEFICTSNAEVMQNSYAYASAAAIPIAWMSGTPTTNYIEKGYAWANLSQNHIYKDGKAGPLTIDEFIEASIELSIYTVDSDTDMNFYASHAKRIKAITTNYPAKLMKVLEYK